MGNERYGPELIAKYRSELLEVQVETVKNRGYMQDVFWRNVEPGDVKVRPFVTKQIMFDMIILEFTVTTWQYDQNFEAIEKVLAMPREDDPSTETDEKRAFQDAMIQCITNANVGSYIWGLDKQPPHTRDFSHELGGLIIIFFTLLFSRLSIKF